ncbi:hypothetical protein AVEN_116175-1 [Araneus ventricosus]|uniref:Uncharacterized protein n=1 Tax=Araneus ventricosus TaxID=182803 RepID=A0A4Y2LFQ1_ARAVE|nr:hypothetical protein AVEN_116175-1 [Araneus ventricosus]
MILVELSDKDPRPCIDYSLLNSSIGNQYFPLPNIEESVERVSASNFIAEIHLAKRYSQIPLSKRARHYAAFVTNFDTYVTLRIPIGSYVKSALMKDMLRTWQDNWEDGDTGRPVFNIIPQVKLVSVDWQREEIMFFSDHGLFFSKSV